LAAPVLGISGAKRNACAAICVEGQVRAVCEQERLTRVRGIGLAAGTLPVEAVNAVVALARARSDDVATYVIAEPQVRLPEALRASVIDHHHAHAAMAFLTSTFDRAAVVVCDTHADRELSVWAGDGDYLADQRWPWQGPAFATLYAQCAELFEFAIPAQPHRLEALAHLAGGGEVEKLENAFQYVDGALRVTKEWRSEVDRLIQDERRRHGHAAETASAIQRRIGELLLEFLADVRSSVEVDALCLAGGLFYNTYFNTLVRASRMFEHTFVPVNPGNAGLAVGASLMVSQRDGFGRNTTAASPFLGPEYDSEAIKATLDGCKLSYEFVSETAAQDAAVAALLRGQLVGWFQGRMEWGHRALGHRSILASPRSEYVLENLNFFLRKRERSRPFGVSVCEDGVDALFCGPTSSPFMEYEYRPRDDRLRHVMPPGATTIRVQTVAPDQGPFRALLKKVEQATGAGVLVNTSFNGFHEPIVCSPLDAIRVFFGTGLDMLVLGQFILKK
jgi:carbamoyltransferase